MGTNKVSTLWTNFTNDIGSITIPAVCWETIAKEVIQLTEKVIAEDEADNVPATYRAWVYPTDLNDKGARERDIVIGYGFMSCLSDVYSIIAIGEDGSIDISDDSFCDYAPPCGEPAMIYSSSSPAVIKPHPPIVDVRYIEVDLACTLDGEGHNTGVQTGISKKQELDKITSTWKDTGEQSAISRTNLSACPPPIPPAPDPYRVGISVGTTSYNIATDTNVAYSPSSDVDFVTPMYAGSNRLFISIPADKALLNVKNAMGISVLSKYNLTAETDNRTGYQNNKVYKGSNVFFTDDYPIQFTIKVS